jgi:hypothetical protein
MSRCAVSHPHYYAAEQVLFMTLHPKLEKSLTKKSSNEAVLSGSTKAMT